MNHEMITKNVRKSKNEQAWINILVRVKIQQAYIQHQASPTTDTDH